MNEIVRINLDNEMDLILAHKRMMKLAELCGLGLPPQTTFATAVSEIARCAIAHADKSYLVLSIAPLALGKKEMVASIFSKEDLNKLYPEALVYARRLLGELPTYEENGHHEIRLRQLLPFGGTFSVARIQTLRDYFEQEPPLSPYDEMRKQNIMLVEMSNRVQKSEQEYRTLADTLPLMMFSASTKGDILYLNKWLRDFFPEGTKLNASLWQSLVYPDDHKGIWQAWDTASTRKSVFRSQGRISNKNGEYIWHLLTMVPVLNEEKEIANWIGFFVDIHSQKLVEQTLLDNEELKEAKAELEIYHEQLEQKIRELKISNQNLEQFAFIASHDLQEPLRKIKMYSNLLLERAQLETKEKGMMDKVINATTRMSDLIKDLLYYSQVSHQESALEEVDLNQIVQDVISDLEVLITEKEARIEVKNLPTLKGISLQYWQLFANLLMNSLKFSKGPPVITIEGSLATETQKQQHRLGNQSFYCLTISDNGVGFDQVFAEKIFVIFQRLNDVQSSGTGIGLALCKKIVENHGGIIVAKGKEGQGATFTLFLPVEPEQVKSHESGSAPANFEREQQSDPSSLRRSNSDKLF